jgi:hypothetical protein
MQRWRSGPTHGIANPKNREFESHPLLQIQEDDAATSVDCINKHKENYMPICKHCNLVEYEKLLSIRNHERRCPENPTRLDLSAKFKSGELVSHWLGRKHSESSKALMSAKAKISNGGYRQGSGRGKKGWYQGFFCDSSWELAYLIFCLDHNTNIKLNLEKRQYQWNGSTKNYIPYFIVEGVLTEIKGYKTEQWLAKLKANPDVVVLYEKDLKPVFEYVTRVYGKDFIRLYE